MHINRLFLFILLAPLSVLQLSCKKFLDVKPDSSLAVPSTLQDLQALMDNTALLNEDIYPSVFELAVPDFYVSYADWLARTVDERANYIWDPKATYYNNWFGPSQVVLYSNIVLDNLPRMPRVGSGLAASEIKGAALFFRAFAWYNLAQLYCPPYDAAIADTALGLPLRTTADINEPSVRATLQQTYTQIVADLEAAAQLLPRTTIRPTRPGKAAAFAALARTLLLMENYEQAARYTDSCLQLQGTLMNFNTLDVSAANPAGLYNPEVIFHASSTTGAIFNPSRAKVDTSLYALYEPADLRLQIFFRRNANGSYAFRANYSGQTGSSFFNGLATDEMYLVRAECHARLGRTKEAMADLNRLLQTRWAEGLFVPYTATSADDALRQVLTERRKELCFRGIRWSDLRRLNKDPRFSVTLTRVLHDGQTAQKYFLPPADPRYVLLIPEEVISITGMQQNPR